MKKARQLSAVNGKYENLIILLSEQTQSPQNRLPFTGILRVYKFVKSNETVPTDGNEFLLLPA